GHPLDRTADSISQPPADATHDHEAYGGNNYGYALLLVGGGIDARQRDRHRAGPRRARIADLDRDKNLQRLLARVCHRIQPLQELALPHGVLGVLPEPRLDHVLVEQGRIGMRDDAAGMADQRDVAILIGTDLADLLLESIESNVDAGDSQHAAVSADRDGHGRDQDLGPADGIEIRFESNTLSAVSRQEIVVAGAGLVIVDQGLEPDFVAVPVPVRDEPTGLVMPVGILEDGV